MEIYPNKIIPRHQLRQPFWISNRDVNKIDHFITATKQAHPVEKDLLAELHEKKLEKQQSQLWFIEPSKDNLFTIRNKNHLYLTLTQSIHHKGENLVKLTPLRKGNGKEHQEWLFVMAQNRRFTIENKHQGSILCLQNVQIKQKPQQYQKVLFCRPKASFQRRYLQNWKLSPLTQTIPLPPDNRMDLVDQSEEAIRPYLLQFKGKIYNEKHHWYQFAKQTYATSSFPPDFTNPYYLAYPQDVEDIQVMLKIAKQIDKKVLARSGGHQYSGMSSGFNNTIVIIMDKFNTMQINKDGLLELGPSNTLKKVSKFLKESQISIPHGQCPLVNIGGHAQTGGYGRFIRSFGLFADYCQGFDIILACGTLHRIRRPTEIKDEKDQLNFQIYRGVLGGNAGSFGIVIKYYLSYIKDNDHPESFGFSRIRFYSERLFKVAMHQFQKWSVLVANGTEETLKGLDLFLTVSQSAHQVTGAKNPHQVIILEGMYSDLEKGKPYANQFEEIFEKFTENESPQQKFLNSHAGGFFGKMKLSEIGHRFVRTYPLMGSSGREFDLPYKRRINVTFSPLQDLYINSVSQQINKVFGSQSLYLIVQMFVWGGEYKEKGNKKINNLTVTSLPQRNALYPCMFDIFYAPNGEQAAIETQQEMQKIVDLHFNTAGKGNKKLFWGSFGDVDMTKPQVVAAYYDSHQDYAVLQKLKQKIDPTDVFHTLMTVKLPTK